MTTVTIEEVYDGARLDDLRALFDEYAAWLDYPACLEGYEEEFASLPGAYAPPRGRLFLATVDGMPAGSAAIRPYDDTTCEMKRLYVRPAYRGTGLGQALIDAVFAGARDAGYTRMVLDTLDQMEAAVRMYRRIGFRDIEQYRGYGGFSVRAMAIDL